MEEQLTPLLKKILKNYHLKHVDMSILNKYYNLFDKKKYLNIGFNELYNDMDDIYHVNLHLLKYGYKTYKKQQEIYQDLVVAVINETDLKRRAKLFH